VVVVVVLVGAIVLTGCGAGSPPESSGTSTTAAANTAAKRTPGIAVPAAAQTVATQLASPDGATADGALTPAAAAAAGAGPLFPAGSTLTLDADSWHQSGRFANATATVKTGAKTSTYEIGFLKTPSGWRVTFATKTS
jgi:hypothetical protein